MKKLLKPNKGVLRIVIEREEEASNSQLLVSPPPLQSSTHCALLTIYLSILLVPYSYPHIVSEMYTPNKSASGSSDHSSSARNTYRAHVEHTDVSSWCSSDDYGGTQNSQDQIPSHYHSRPDSYHSATQESNASQVCNTLLINYLLFCMCVLSVGASKDRGTEVTLAFRRPLLHC